MQNICKVTQIQLSNTIIAAEQVLIPYHTERHTSTEPNIKVTLNYSSWLILHVGSRTNIMSLSALTGPRDVTLLSQLAHQWTDTLKIWLCRTVGERICVVCRICQAARFLNARFKDQLMKHIVLEGYKKCSYSLKCMPKDIHKI